MSNNNYNLLIRPEIPFLMDISYKETTVKDFGQAILNSNKFKRKQKHKKH